MLPVHARAFSHVEAKFREYEVAWLRSFTIVTNL